MEARFTNRQSERINIQRPDAKAISELADQHPANPNGFINSLDDFFRNMCMEMAAKRGDQKGGVI